MKAYYTILAILFLSVNLFAQSWSDEENCFTSTIEGGQNLKGKTEVDRTPTCSGFIYEQDIALNDFGRKGYSPSEAQGESWKLYDDFPITTTSTIRRVILNVVDFDPVCSSPEIIINFRSNGTNGTYGQILHTRTVAPGAATYTKDCVIPQWTAEFYYIFNIHIPIAPVTLAPGTYWMEIHSPNQPSFISGIFWETTRAVQGFRARREYFGQNYNFQNLDFAFALSESTDLPDSYCQPLVEAVCQNANVTLQNGGQATLNASAVDGGSSNFTNISVSPSTFNCSNKGPNTVTLTVDDGNGNSDNCTATVTVLDGQGLPGNWDDHDIGTITLGNTYNFEACNAIVNNQFSIVGSGNNATNMMSDNVAFASLNLCGDGSLTAKIENVDATGYGGLMMRETTATGSKQVSIFTNMSSLLRLESRTMTNGAKTVQSLFKPNAIWLRMRRVGTWVHVEYSQNGMMYLPVQSVFVSMQNCIEIGLASFNFQPIGQTTALFSNVATTGNVSLTGDDSSAFGSNQPPHVDAQAFMIEREITLYPNPTRGNFTLQLDEPLEEDGMVEVLNMYGQSIAQQNLAVGQIRQEWNTMDWPVGTYLIRINMQGQQAMMKKLVVTK